MKKVFVSILSVGIVFGGLLYGSIQVGASSESQNLVEPAAYTKTVTQTNTYSKSQSVPSIPYEVNGWIGTLYLQSTADAGDQWIAYYKGTVTCSVNCVMTKTEEE